MYSKLIVMKSVDSVSREAIVMILSTSLLIGTITHLFSILVSILSRLARLLVFLDLEAAELGVRTVHQVCVTMLLEAHFYQPVLVEFPLQVCLLVGAGSIIVLV